MAMATAMRTAAKVSREIEARTKPGTGARRISGSAFPIQILSLDAIKVDHSLQSRVETSLAYQKEFSEAMLRGDTFPPVTVFFDGKKYWLADGFHRVGAARHAAKLDAKLRGIRAEVRGGSKEDAVVFSAGANQKYSIPRKPEDVRKAVYMLLDVQGWFTAAATVLGKHIGCSSTTAQKYRAGYCAERGLEVPGIVAQQDGRLISAARKSDPAKVKLQVNKQKCGTAFFARIDGRRQYIGMDAGKVEAKLAEVQDDYDAGKNLLQPDGLSQFLIYRGFSFKGAAFNPTQFPGLSAYHGHGVVYVAERFERKTGGNQPESLPAAVGRVLMARVHLDPGARAVIVCYRDSLPKAMIPLAEALGIEFLSPHELAASLKV